MSSGQVTNKLTILYADDDTDDLEFLGEAFGKYAEHIELITVQDGIEALLYLVSIAPHDSIPCLIILDINMPGMSGKQALTEIRSMERFADVPVVLYSTSSHPADQEFAIMRNAAFVTKPLATRELERIAGVMLNHCHPNIQQKLVRRAL
jgi:CheY-like chemotaxis protein